MNVKYVNAICRATKGIMDMHFGLSVKALAPTAGIGSFPSNDVSVILGVKGELTGQIVCTFSRKTAKKIVGSMMGGITVEQLDEIGWSAVQEYGNWVAGTAATELSKEDCLIDVTPPIVNEGDSHYHSASPFVTVPFHTPIGEIDIHISVKEVLEEKKGREETVLQQ